MLRAMTTDEERPAQPTDEVDAGPEPSLWWALHRPETYALTAFTLGFIDFVGRGPLYDVVRSYMVFATEDNTRVALGVPAALQAALALLAAGLAVASIRSEDEDVTWSASVARTALVVAALAFLLSVVSLFGIVTTNNEIPGFNAPSP